MNKRVLVVAIAAAAAIVARKRGSSKADAALWREATAGAQRYESAKTPR